MREYRLKKLEYYGKSVNFLNFYMRFLLPCTLVLYVVRFTWQATVPGAGFSSPYAALLEFWMVAVCFAAMVAIGNIDRYAFFSNILAIISVAAYQIVWALSPKWLNQAASAQGADIAVNQAGDMMAEMSGEMAVSGMADGAAQAVGGMMDGMEQAVSAGGGIGGLLSKWLKTDQDLSTFLVTVRCELILVICGLMIFYFINHRKLFFTTLEAFRATEHQ